MKAIIEKGTIIASRQTLKTEKGLGLITKNLYMPRPAPIAGIIEPAKGANLLPKRL
ncbi:MAG: hypothetical protein ACP5M8_05175 [Caldisphaera sp.]